jgi:hypothetical protein
MVDEMIATNDKGRFMELYGALLNSPYGKNKPSLEKIFKEVEQVEDFFLKIQDPEEKKSKLDKMTFRAISSFGSSKGQEMTNNFKELFVKPQILDDDETPTQDSNADQETPDSPEPDTTSSVDGTDEKPEKEKNTQSNEEIVKSELRKVFDGSDEEFDEAFDDFIKDLRKLKQLEEVGQKAAKDSMGITKKQYLEFQQKHQKIFAAIKLALPYSSKTRVARQRFLKALGAISTTGSEEYYQQQDKERLRTISSKDPSGEPFKTDREIEDRTGSTKDDSKTDDNAAEKTPKKQYKFPRLYQAPSTKKANQKSYSKTYQSGLEGKKYKFTGNIFNTTEEEYESIEKAYEKWRDLDYSMRGTPYIQAYLSGLQEYIENKAGQKNASQTIEDDSEETLNESAMVRWKELAGIL